MIFNNLVRFLTFSLFDWHGLSRHNLTLQCEREATRCAHEWASQKPNGSLLLRLRIRKFLIARFRTELNNHVVFQLFRIKGSEIKMSCRKSDDRKFQALMARISRDPLFSVTDDVSDQSPYPAPDWCRQSHTSHWDQYFVFLWYSFRMHNKRKYKIIGIYFKKKKKNLYWCIAHLFAFDKVTRSGLRDLCGMLVMGTRKWQLRHGRNLTWQWWARGDTNGEDDKIYGNWGWRWTQPRQIPKMSDSGKFWPWGHGTFCRRTFCLHSLKSLSWQKSDLFRNINFREFGSLAHTVMWFNSSTRGANLISGIRWHESDLCEQERLSDGRQKVSSPQGQNLPEWDFSGTCRGWIYLRPQTRIFCALVGITVLRHKSFWVKTRKPFLISHWSKAKNRRIHLQICNGIIHWGPRFSLLI